MSKEKIQMALKELTELAEQALSVNSQLAHARTLFEANARLGNHPEADQQRGKIHALLDQSLDITERSIQLQDIFLNLQK